MAIMIMYKDGVPFFIKDRKSTDQLLRKNKYEIEYISTDEPVLLKFSQEILESKKIAGPITKLLPEMYHNLPSVCDGAEIVGLLLRPINLKAPK